MKRIRQIHLWLGVLFSPAILFFAFTGILQTFGWHEAHKNSAYMAPAWIAKLAQIHKHQQLARASGGPSPLPLKWFVALMGAGLIITSLLGIYMAFKYQRNAWIVWGLIAAGVMLPVILLYL
jgi:hypothetical protein